MDQILHTQQRRGVKQLAGLESGALPEQPVVTFDQRINSLFRRRKLSLDTRGSPAILPTASRKYPRQIATAGGDPRERKPEREPDLVPNGVRRQMIELSHPTWSAANRTCPRR